MMMVNIGYKDDKCYSKRNVELHMTNPLDLSLDSLVLKLPFFF